MYSSISKNKRMTVVIFTMFIAIISGIGLFFALASKNMSVFWWALIGSLIYAGVEYAFSSKIALAMTGAQEVTHSQAPQLYAAVETISITAGLPMPKVYIIDDPAPNAFAAGTKPENSLVCVTTGLLDIMDKSELEAVIAHEIGHIKNYDVRLSMAAVALTASIGFLADIAIRIVFRDDKDSKNAVMMIVGLIFAIISPILAAIVRMAISREREYLADATAVMLTRYPEGMIGALEKLRDYSRPMARQSSTVSGLFISNTLEKGFFSNLFSTHPPLEKRIMRLKQNAGRF
ncbi:MAG: M48 family metalloprotease [bacterium]|nr:M48 family metalloprotease [bacterium]